MFLNLWLSFPFCKIRIIIEPTSWRRGLLRRQNEIMDAKAFTECLEHEHSRHISDDDDIYDIKISQWADDSLSREMFVQQDINNLIELLVSPSCCLGHSVKTDKTIRKCPHELVLG